MTVPDTPQPADPRKPRDDEIDVHGLTHVGKVRKANQDHFLIASVHKHVQIHLTSLSGPQQGLFGNERVAFFSMIADGVGGGEGGEQASSTTLEVASRYVVESMNCYYSADASEATFIDALQAAAVRSHQAVVERAKATPGLRSMATTLTLWMGVWPWVYLLQVGDSRHYVYRDGTLTQVTRDQTIAQDLVDKGVFTRADAERSQFSQVLSSAIGGPETMPVVTRIRNDWGVVHLGCSDGLTKHVSDERIAERLAAMTSARQVSEQLLQDALDDGGTDNITIIVGRAVPKDLPA